MEEEKNIESLNSDESFDHIEIEYEREAESESEDPAEIQESLLTDLVEDWQEIDEGDLQHNSKPSEINPECIFDTTYTPEDLFDAIFDEFLEYIVKETNEYGNHKKTTKKGDGYLETYPSSRLHRWEGTNKDEMKKFFGLILVMGIEKKENAEGIQLSILPNSF